MRYHVLHFPKITIQPTTDQVRGPTPFPQHLKILLYQGASQCKLFTLVVVLI